MTPAFLVFQAGAEPQVALASTPPVQEAFEAQLDHLQRQMEDAEAAEGVADGAF